MPRALLFACLLCALTGCRTMLPVRTAPSGELVAMNEAYDPTRDPVYQEHLRRVTEERKHLLEKERAAAPWVREDLKQARLAWEREQSRQLSGTRDARQQEWQRRHPRVDQDHANQDQNEPGGTEQPTGARSAPATRSAPARDLRQEEQIRQDRSEGLWKSRQRREHLRDSAPLPVPGRPSAVPPPVQD
jgi:hypothetical protein